MITARVSLRETEAIPAELAVRADGTAAAPTQAEGPTAAEVETAAAEAISRGQ
jgi:hypothetical protein